MSCSPSLTKQPNYSYNKHWYNKSSSKYMLQWMWLCCSKVRLLHRCIALARFACTLLHARNWSLVSRIWQPCFFSRWRILQYICDSCYGFFAQIQALQKCMDLFSVKNENRCLALNHVFSADKSTRTSAIRVSILALIQAFHKYRPIFR